MNRIERACRFQIAPLNGGAEPNPIPSEIVDYTGTGTRASLRARRGGKLLWRAAPQARREDPTTRPDAKSMRGRERLPAVTRRPLPGLKPSFST